MRNAPCTRPLPSLTLRWLILILAAFLLLAMQRSGQLQAFGRALAQLASPVQWRLYRETIRLPASFQQLAQNRLDRERQQALLAANRQLAAENAALQETLRENQRLRRQLAYANANPRFTFQGAFVVGQVLMHEPHNFLDYIVIDAGENRGLAVGMPVLAPEGLVGRIAAVAPRTARVLLLQDVSSSVSGLTQSSRVSGQVAGAADGRLRMQFISTVDLVAVGENVVTSHLSASLPQGIPIGTVTALEEERNSTAVRAVIQPAVDARRLEAVMVIVDFDSAFGAAPALVAPAPDSETP